MTESTPSAAAEPDTTPGTLHGANADQAPEPQLRTFDEMLIAVRAFHRNSRR